MIKIGNLDIENIKLGQSDISAVYLGDNKIYEESPSWFTEVDYVYTTTTSTWQNYGIAFGWLPVKQFSLDVDSVSFFCDAKKGTCTTGQCLCTDSNNSSTTVQTHIGGDGAYMLTTRVYNSSSQSSGDWRVDVPSMAPETQYTFSSAFTVDNPTVEVNNSPITGRWNSGSAATYNPARQLHDGATIKYIRLSFDPTYTGASYKFSSKIHNFCVYNNGEKVIDIIPILITATNRYALYDKISKNYIDSVSANALTVYFDGE